MPAAFRIVTFAAVNAEITVLQSDSLQDNNSLDEPTKVTPQTSSRAIPASDFEHEFAPHTLTLIRIPIP